MLEEIISDSKNKFQAAVEYLTKELSGIRTSHVGPNLIEDLVVDAYGGTYPLKELGAISVPEPNQILIQTWDQSVIENISNAILKSNLGLTPNIEGSNIRLIIPPLSEERRKETIKLVNNKCEEGKVAIRNIRQTKMKSLDNLLEENMISEDERDRYRKNIQDLVDQCTEKIEELQTSKVKTLEM